MDRKAFRRLGATVAALTLLVSSAAPASAQRARQGLLSLEDARIFYEVVGSGEPIVVVHGGPGLDHAYLQPGLDALATRNTLVYYDQRGVGRSTAELDTTGINLDAFLGDIEALREALGYDRITVLAHSFGALFGLEYAARFPDRTRALILMNPAEPGSRFAEQAEERRSLRRSAEDAAELTELMATEGFEARDPATLSQVYRVAFRASMRDADRVAELDLDLSQSTAKNGSEVGTLLGVDLGEIDWWDRLPEIEVPALVLAGRYDLAPVEMARALAEALPRGSYEVLEAGHFPYLEDREGLLAAISGFFARLDR